jgi:hypothetical protein
MTLALAACSSNSSPESTLQAFYQAAANADVEKATALISFRDVPAAKMVAAKGKVQMIVGEMQATVQANGGLDKVEILETKMDEAGQTATIKAKLTYKNGKEHNERHTLRKEDDGWKLVLGK